MTTNNKVCPQCGSLNPINYMFCLACQARLPKVKEQPTGFTFNLSIFAIVTGLVVAALEVFFLALFFSNEILPFGLILFWAAPGTLGALLAGAISSEEDKLKSGCILGAVAGGMTALWLSFWGLEGILGISPIFAIFGGIIGATVGWGVKIIWT